MFIFRNFRLNDSEKYNNIISNPKIKLNKMLGPKPIIIISKIKNL